MGYSYCIIAIYFNRNLLHETSVSISKDLINSLNLRDNNGRNRVLCFKFYKYATL